MLKTSAYGLGFQHLPRDLANVNAWKTMFDPYIKISNVNISNMPIFFVETNVRSFCSAKASLIFQQKYISVFAYKVVKHFTS